MPVVLKKKSIMEWVASPYLKERGKEDKRYAFSKVKPNPTSGYFPNFNISVSPERMIRLILWG